MGAKLAHPDKLCINVWGDAAIGFTGMDFETAVRERIPILSILLNNFSMAIELKIMKTATQKYRRTDISGDYADDGQGVRRLRRAGDRPGEIVPAIKRGHREDPGGNAGAARVHHRKGRGLLDVRHLARTPTMRNPSHQGYSGHDGEVGALCRRRRGGQPTGAFLARAGHDATFIDPWPEQVEAIRTRGIPVTGPHDPFQAKAKALHVHEAQQLDAPLRHRVHRHEDLRHRRGPRTWRCAI